MMLENLLHEDSSFVTLTYAPEHEPEGGTLVPKDLQDWLKRLRKFTSPVRLRYLAVGEYGGETGRPHYHAIVYGLPTCLLGDTRGHSSQRSLCSRCRLVSDTWGKGRILLGTVTPESCQYVSGYVVKKMTGVNDERLQGRYPEFARMSLKPGIGLGALDAIFDVSSKLNLVNTQGDVPSTLRHGNKIWPLGRYLTRKLRELHGLAPNAPQATVDKLRQEVLDMQKIAQHSEEFVSVRQLLLDKDQTRVASLEAKAKMYRKRNTI